MSHAVTRSESTALAQPAQASVDPLARIASVGGRASVSFSVLLALAMHAGVASAGASALALRDFLDWQSMMRSRLHDRLMSEYEVDVVREPDPPKEPEVQEPEKKDPLPDAPKDLIKDAPQDAPPAAAQAAQVMAQDPKPAEPLDFTNSFVQGAGTNYAGGATAPQGTSTTAVRTPGAAGTGVPGGTGTSTAPQAAVDRSRALRLRGGLDWDCPFPPEADTEQIDQAAAVIEVSVGADGRVQSVRLISDPGHGFGRQARACAMGKSFESALDRDGNPLASTKQFRVTFNR